jgi:hypothetical protein
MLGKEPMPGVPFDLERDASLELWERVRHDTQRLVELYEDTPVYPDSYLRRIEDVSALGLFLRVLGKPDLYQETINALSGKRASRYGVNANPARILIPVIAFGAAHSPAMSERDFNDARRKWTAPKDPSCMAEMALFALAKAQKSPVLNYWKLGDRKWSILKAGVEDGELVPFYLRTAAFVRLWNEGKFSELSLPASFWLRGKQEAEKPETAIFDVYEDLAMTAICSAESVSLNENGVVLKLATHSLSSHHPLPERKSI